MSINALLVALICITDNVVIMDAFDSFNQLANSSGVYDHSLFVENEIGVDARSARFGMPVYNSFEGLAINNGLFDGLFGKKRNDSPVIPLTQIDSSYLAQVGYDPNRSVMTVMFWDGSVFEYDNVSQGEWNTLMQAQSHGQWFYYNIRDDKRFRQLESSKTKSHPGYATRSVSVASEWA